MALPTVIIITGLPGTGKTTLGTRIAASFTLPCLHKDGLKELLFDAVGWKDRAFSKQLSRASYRLLFHFTQVLLSAGNSLIVEANFDADAHTQRFLELQEVCAYRPLQILCHAEGAVLQKRFEQRRAQAIRHPGHLDEVLSKELAPILREGRTAPLAVGGQLLELDTTDFGRLNLNSLLRTVRATLQAR